MKYTVTFLVSAVSIIVVLARSPFDDYRDVCIEELHLDASKFPPPPPHVPGQKPGNFTPMELTHDMACILRCMLQKDGSLNSVDELQIDKVKSRLPPNVDIDISKCAAIKKSDPCVTAAERHRCVMQQLPKPPHMNQ